MGFLRLGCVLLMVLALGGARSFGGDPGVEIRRETARLRGFGKIELTAHLDRSDGHELGRVVFRCESPEKAKITGSKYLADLLAYGAVREVAMPEFGGTVLEIRHGGCWLLGLSGSEFQLYSAPSAAQLRTMRPPRLEPVPRGAYPAYLDNFDNAGLGIWWMSSTKSPEQLAWMKQYPAVANLHDQRLDNIPAVGVYDVTGLDNSINQLRGIDQHYRHMLWAGGGDAAWTGGFATLPGEAIDHQLPGFCGSDLFRAAGYGSSQAASELVNAVVLDAMVNTIRKRVDDPRLLAWMEPHGEFNFIDPVPPPPGAAGRFGEYLRTEKKYTLDQLNARYGTAYADFAEVPFPEPAYFSGRRGAVLDLDREPWRWCGGTLAEGEAQGCWRGDYDDGDWFRARRENKQLLGKFPTKSGTSSLWGRGVVEVPAEFLRPGRKLYCHILPYTEGRERSISLWVNGREAGRELGEPEERINRGIGVEISGLLRPGRNLFVVHSAGGRIAYRMFLSDQPPERYPYRDSHLNAQYLDWRDFLIAAKFRTLKQFLQAIRAVDPVRPIKVMTPHLFQSEAFDLFERYGAYPQLTGEGGWYRPMHYKGYSRLRGLPGSSEPGGPRKTAAATQEMFGLIFWEAQDCHDYVFDLNRELWQHKEALRWWNEKADFMRTLGKVDFATPKLGVLRDVRQSERYRSNGIWNWDLSRGALPALGLTPVLVDGPDLIKGYADRCPVLFDCATQVMEPELIAALKRYVEQGGIFIAQHHTGQHSELVRDNWPLATALGLKVTPKWITPENHHQWPLATIEFTPTQTLLPSLRGRRIHGSGVAIDHLDNRYTGGIRIDGEPAEPIARWEDGSIAIAEVRYGRGRFILLGSPFYLRMQDENGKWCNAEQRQAYLAELLASCGVRAETAVSDPAIWFERRESKNGLYEVYCAGALGVRGEWDLGQRIRSELRAMRPGAVPAVEPGVAGCPEVPTNFREGWLSFGEQEFAPYQIRQFAVLRPEVGIRAPDHWLGVQERTWRPLTPVDPAVVEEAAARVRAYAREQGEEGIDLNADWQLQIDGADQWVPGRMGSWSAIGHPGARRIVYRRSVELPESWRQGARITLGMTGGGSSGLQGSCRLRVNGELYPEPLARDFAIDLSAYAASGRLELELDLTGPRPGPLVTRGPSGTLYLRKTPLPRAVIPLPEVWRVSREWCDPAPGSGRLPFTGSALILGTEFEFPAAYAGRPVRLVIEFAEPGNRNSRVWGVLVNGEGYFRSEQFSPIGQRLDRFLKPGRNTLELLGRQHLKGQPTVLKIKRVALEVY